MGKKSFVNRALYVILLISLAFEIFLKDQELKAYIVVGGIMLVLIVVHLFMPLLAGLTPENTKVKTMRRYNVLLGAVILVLFITRFLRPQKEVAENDRILLTFSVLITLVIGNAAPKIPINRIMGIRFPWTVNDPDTWRVAHKMLGYCAFLVALIMLFGGLLIHPVIFSVGGLLVLALIPSIYSYVYYKRK